MFQYRHVRCLDRVVFAQDTVISRQFLFLNKEKCYWKLTFSPHAHFETFSEPAILALISVMLVDGAISVPST